MKSVPIHSPSEPWHGGLTVSLEEPRSVNVRIVGAGRDLNAHYLEGDHLAGAHILEDDVLIYDKDRRPRPGDVVLVHTGDDEEGPQFRLFDPATMDAETRDEWGRVPRHPGAVFGTLVGLVRVPRAGLDGELAAEEGGRRWS